MEEGLLQLGDPIKRWMPEFANMRVLASPNGPVEATEPAARDITVEDLFTHRGGLAYAFTSIGPIAKLMEEKLPAGLAPDPLAGGARWRFPLQLSTWRTFPLQPFDRRARLSRRHASPAWGCATSCAVASSNRCRCTTPISGRRRRSATAPPWSIGPMRNRSAATGAVPRVQRAAGVLFGRRRSGLHRRRLSALRPAAAERRRHSTACSC